MSGLQAEALVIGHYLNLGYCLFRQRWRTPYAEIDLLFTHPRNNKILLLVEVKRRCSLEFRDLALSRRQKARLIRAVNWLSEAGHLVECQLAFVGKRDEIEILSDVFG